MKTFKILLMGLAVAFTFSTTTALASNQDQINPKTVTDINNLDVESSGSNNPGENGEILIQYTKDLTPGVSSKSANTASYGPIGVVLYSNGNLYVTAQGYTRSCNIYDVNQYVGYNHCTSGNPVYCAQQLLNASKIGNSLVVDGYFGPATHAAIINFQSTHGLSIDGTVGPNTWESLVRNAQ